MQTLPGGSVHSVSNACRPAEEVIGPVIRLSQVISQVMRGLILNKTSWTTEKPRRDEPRKTDPDSKVKILKYLSGDSMWLPAVLPVQGPARNQNCLHHDKPNARVSESLRAS